MDIGGWIMPYERDLIAERDEKNRLDSSVVKWWRVNYIDHIMMEQLKEEERRLKEEDEAMKLALEVTARLEAEAAEDEAIKQAEIARVLAETQAVEEAEFNATTGTFSGRYGKNVTLDEEGMNQVESILNQKKSDIQKIVSEYND